MNTEHKKRKYGPTPKPASELRRIRVSSFFTKGEFEELLCRSTGANPPAFLRKAALGTLESRVPEINKKAWESLARASANLNQIAASLNMMWQEGALPGLPEIENIKIELADFRNQILGISISLR